MCTSEISMGLLSWLYFLMQNFSKNKKKTKDELAITESGLSSDRKPENPVDSTWKSENFEVCGQIN